MVGESIRVKAHPEPRALRHTEPTILELERLGDHIAHLIVVVGIVAMGHHRRRGPEVERSRRTNPQITVTMDGHAKVEGLADRGNLLRLRDTTPEVEIN